MSLSWVHKLQLAILRMNVTQHHRWFHTWLYYKMFNITVAQVSMLSFLHHLHGKRQVDAAALQRSVAAMQVERLTGSGERCDCCILQSSMYGQSFHQQLHDGIMNQCRTIYLWHIEVYFENCSIKHWGTIQKEPASLKNPQSIFATCAAHR